MKKSEISLIPEETIEGKILLIRGKKVILDRDLALLYGVKTIRLREQVKRNSERFPEDFTFQLMKDEANMLVSQNAIPTKRNLGGYLPHVFTEHGTLMATSVIKSSIAIRDDNREIAEIKKLKKLDPSRIKFSLRKIFGEEDSLTRNIEIYLLRKYSDKTLKELGSDYGNLGVSGISHIVRRLEERRRKNNQFDKRIREAEEFLSNGQARPLLPVSTNNIVA